MALFKISKGNKTNLPTKLTEGYAYFCEDTHEFYIDHHDPQQPDNPEAVLRSLIRADASNIHWHTHTSDNEETETSVDSLHIHTIPNQEMYDSLAAAGKIISNHLYMIDGPMAPVVQIIEWGAGDQWPST